MTRREVIGDAELWLGDCRELLSELPSEAAIVSDPPYGMGWNIDLSRFSGGSVKRGRARDWGSKSIVGDNIPFDPTLWLHFSEVVLWGANHYARLLPIGTTLVWLKKHPGIFGTFLSDAEIGWRKGGRGVYCHYEQFPPPARIVEAGGVAAHPTQKPIGLMAWCIGMTKADIIADPFMGSGTTAIACRSLGRRFVGVERDPVHFATACRRIEAAYRQPDMLLPAALPRPEQATLALESTA